MCDFCNDQKWKDLRGMIAADAIGHFCPSAKDDSPEGIEPFVEKAVENFAAKVAVLPNSPTPCSDLSRVLTERIKGAWHKIPLEEKFRMSLAAGAIKLGA